MICLRHPFCPLPENAGTRNMHECVFIVQRRRLPIAQNWDPRGPGKTLHPAAAPVAVVLGREWAEVRPLLLGPLVPDAQPPSDGWSAAAGGNKAEKRARQQDR